MKNGTCNEVEESCFLLMGGILLTSRQQRRASQSARVGHFLSYARGELVYTCLCAHAPLRLRRLLTCACAEQLPLTSGSSYGTSPWTEGQMVLLKSSALSTTCPKPPMLALCALYVTCPWNLLGSITCICTSHNVTLDSIPLSPERITNLMYCADEKLFRIHFPSTSL